MSRQPLHLPCWPLALWFACTTTPKDTGLGRDQDHDGVSPPEDCDDLDASVYPGAVEVCDGVDNTCDGAVDDTDPYVVVTGYMDADGDGSPGTTPRFCADVTSETADDCDDANAAVHPGAAETCATEEDDDCDGETNPVDALGCVTWYLDEDGDGAGVVDSACRCAAQAPYSSDRWDDCDDADPTASPLLGTCRLWGDVGLIEDAAAIIGPCPHDKGTCGAFYAGDLNADGRADLALVDAGDGDAQAGRLLVYHGDVAGDLAWGEADVVLTGNADDALARDLARLDDIDGDDLPDLLLCSSAIVEGSSFAYLVPTPLPAAGGVADLGVRLTTPVDRVGCHVSAAGDQDGDGYGEALYLANADLSDAARDPVVYLVDGPVGEDSALSEIAVGSVYGASGELPFGFSVDGRGDLTGDGVADVLVGVRDASNDQGASVLEGPVVGERAALDADLQVLITDSGSESRAAYARDLTGDGIDDLVLGQPQVFEDGEGGLPIAGAFVFDGTGRGARTQDDALATWEGQAWDGELIPEEPLGDVNGDGYAELALGSGGAGCAYVLYGPVAGTLGGDDADATIIPDPGGVPYPPESGLELTQAGDVDGDGSADLLLWGNLAQIQDGSDVPGEVTYWLHRGGWGS